MIEKAAVAITNYLDPVREKKHNGQWDEFDYGQAQAVVDAILPQVSTVEELKALPIGSIYLARTGGGMFPERVTRWTDFTDSELEDYLWKVGPLTVVCQPWT